MTFAVAPMAEKCGEPKVAIQCIGIVVVHQNILDLLARLLIVPNEFYTEKLQHPPTVHAFV
jgi:hypothetical protein